MKNTKTFLKLAAILSKKGFVITEKKPHNKRGKNFATNCYIIEPIAALR